MELDILDTSSDSSSNTTILCTSKEIKNDSAGPSSVTESELDSLFKKYLSEDFNIKYNSSEQPTPPSHHEILNCDTLKVSKYSSNEEFCHNLNTHLLGIGDKIPVYDLDSLSDYDLPTSSQIKRLKTSNSDIPEVLLLSSSDETELPSEYKKKISNKEKKKTEKEKIQKQKLEEKELKREEERKNKALKNALTNHYKNMKPDHCLKFIKAHIDLEISRRGFSEDIINELQNNGISFVIEPQLTDSSISWTRQIDSHVLDTNGKLIDTSKGLKIEEVLLIMECIEFVNHINNQTFLTFIENLYTVLIGKKIVLIIYGLERYYRFQKNKKKQNFAEVSSKTHKNITDQRLFENEPTVSRRTVEYALTEVQLLYSMSHRMVETKQEIALLVFQMTKSIAQLPYKLEKQEKFLQSKWFMSEDNKNCIRVDRNGNGLPRLWKQIITTFPLATLETAEAICSLYPTPLSLFKAYNNITNFSDGEKLLQDVPIRRAAGPISTMRKVGPELSKKFYYLFTSLDPDQIL